MPAVSKLNHVCTYDKCGGRPEDTGHTASGVKLAEPVPFTGNAVQAISMLVPIFRENKRVLSVVEG